MTDVERGVSFDLNGDGIKERVSWTALNSGSAFLVLDRNSNGNIDNGGELFGNFTEQPNPAPGGVKNGFLALAVFDLLDHGGNNDGSITASDSIYSHLRLWHDRNHNGVVDPGELTSLLAEGILGIELDYKVSRKTDEHGNQFRYRSKLMLQQGARATGWAWDVILKSEQLD